MLSLRALLFVALAVCYALAVPQTEDGVYVLGKDTFNDFVAGDVSLVEFYAPWCGHCKTLAPEYAKAAADLAKDNIRLGKVDSTVESELAGKYGVTGYPTMKVFRGGNPTEYKGPRDASGIAAYMRKQAAPAISVFKNLAELEKFVQDDAAVVYFGDLTGKAYKAFEQVAAQQRETYRFGQTTAEDILAKYGHKDEVVLVQSKRYTQSPLEVATLAHKDGDLASFITNNLLPLVGELTNDNQAHYHGKGLPIVKIYSDLNWALNSKGANYLLNKIRRVAKEYKDKFVFAVTSRTKNTKEVDDSALPKGENPFAIHDVSKGHKYPASSLFSGDSLKEHLEAFLANKLEPHVKSEAVPESQPEGKPVVVVGKNFADVVLDPSKDVLLEAYAPWCGHCKTLEPKYNELADEMKGYSDTLTIAKVDATANDVPPKFAVTGFPTIFFVPANKKDAPIKYEGAREVKDFISYIKKHASLPLKEKASTLKTEL